MSVPTIIVLSLLGVTLAVIAAEWLSARRTAGVAELKRRVDTLVKQLDAADEAIGEIEAKAYANDLIDSVLSGEVREIIKNLRKEQRSLR